MSTAFDVETSAAHDQASSGLPVDAARKRQMRDIRVGRVFLPDCPDKANK